MSLNRNFSPEDDRRLVELRRHKNLTWGQIGIQLGRTAVSCRGRFTNLAHKSLRQQLTHSGRPSQHETFPDLDQDLNNGFSAMHADHPVSWSAIHLPGQDTVERQRLCKTPSSSLLQRLARVAGEA